MIGRICAVWLIVLATSAHAQTGAVRLDKRPMRDSTGVVIGYLLLATNTTNQVQCVIPRAEPALTSGGGIFKARLVLKPRERGVAFARYMGGAHFNGVMIHLDPDRNCPERGPPPSAI